MPGLSIDPQPRAPGYLATGDVQIYTTIQRLLTGYAVSYYRKHRRPDLGGGGRIRMVGG